MLSLFATMVLLFSCQKKLITLETNKGESVQQIQTTKDLPFQTQFLLSLPDEYEQEEQWPLLLFLHGSGERGTDIEKVAVHGPPKLARQGKLQQFIVISPQCPAGDYWDSYEQQKNLIQLLQTAKKELKVDEDRIYVTGLSMGGFGTWELAANLHDEIAAAVPICGGGSIWNARLLKDIPIWAFHGSKDDVVPPVYSEEMIEAIEEQGGNPKLTIFPDANHNSWDPAYDMEELFEWLLKQKRK